MSLSYILERVRFQSGQVVCTVWPVFYTTSGLTFLFITDFEQKHGFGPGASMSLVDIPFKRNSCRTPIYSQINVPAFNLLYILVLLIFFYLQWTRSVRICAARSCRSRPASPSSCALKYNKIKNKQGIRHLFIILPWINSEIWYPAISLYLLNQFKMIWCKRSQLNRIKSYWCNYSVPYSSRASPPRRLDHPEFAFHI